MSDSVTSVNETQTTAPVSSRFSPHPIQAAVSPSSSPVTQSAHNIAPITIALAVVVSVTGSIFLFAIIRCLISYRKTPHYDRVSVAIDRQLVYREMSEYWDLEIKIEECLPVYTRPPSFISVEETPSDELESDSGHSLISPALRHGHLG